jgi:hypothetical protein
MGFASLSRAKGGKFPTEQKLLLAAVFFMRFFWLCRCFLESVSAVRRIFFSAAVGLMSLILGSICFRFFVPLELLLGLRRPRNLFSNCARVNFTFQFVNPL